MGDLSREGLDEWIATLYECKPLTEPQVKQLCDKVGDVCVCVLPAA